jgi:hypothetical protein
MKNGKVTTDAALAYVKRMLPSDVRDRVLGAIESCRHASDGEHLEDITRKLYFILTTAAVT